MGLVDHEETAKMYFYYLKKLISVRQALEDPAWLGSMLGAESFAGRS